MEEAFVKLFSKVYSGNWNFGFQRATDFSMLTAALEASDISSSSQKVPQSHFQRFSLDVAIQVRHEFKSFSVTGSASSEENSEVL